MKPHGNIIREYLSTILISFIGGILAFISSAFCRRLAIIFSLDNCFVELGAVRAAKYAFFVGYEGPADLESGRNLLLDLGFVELQID